MPHSRMKVAVLYKYLVVVDQQSESIQLPCEATQLVLLRAREMVVTDS